MRKSNTYFKTAKTATNIIQYCLVVLVTLLIVFPIIYIIPFAWKNKSEFNSMLLEMHWLPKKFVWTNFTQIFKVNVNGGYFLRALWMTLLVAILGTTLVVIINILAGFGFARHDFPCKKILFAFVLFTMFIPGITIMLTSVRLCNILHLNNTIFVLFIPGAANGFNIFLFRQYYLSFPKEYEEAAEIDGASRLQIFTKIYLPLSSTPIVIVAVGAFMGHWNNYLWPTLTITENEEWYTQIMQITKALSGSPATTYGYGIVIAGTLISLIIPFVLYVFFQKKIVEGISLTGIK